MDIEVVYMVVLDNGRFYRSGRNYTPATFTSKSVAKRWANDCGGKAVEISFVEDVK